jgi:putative ABC transport system permease protein
LWSLQQLRFTQNKDLGLTKENVIVIPNVHSVWTKVRRLSGRKLLGFRTLFIRSISTNVPLSGGFGDFLSSRNSTRATSRVAKDLTLVSFMTDDEFIKTLAIKLTKGRDFSKEFSDSTSVILNEAAVKQIGWKDPDWQVHRLSRREYAAF